MAEIYAKPVGVKLPYGLVALARRGHRIVLHSKQYYSLITKLVVFIADLKVLLVQSASLPWL
jgi:hypothetical protein